MHFLINSVHALEFCFQTRNSWVKFLELQSMLLSVKIGSLVIEICCCRFLLSSSVIGVVSEIEHFNAIYSRIFVNAIFRVVGCVV
jgi:hypothetical protein